MPSGIKTSDAFAHWHTATIWVVDAARLLLANGHVSTQRAGLRARQARQRSTRRRRAVESTWESEQRRNRMSNEEIHT